MKIFLRASPRTPIFLVGLQPNFISPQYEFDSHGPVKTSLETANNNRVEANGGWGGAPPGDHLSENFALLLEFLFRRILKRNNE